MPTRTLLGDPLEVVLKGLHEAHDLSAYEAVERLVRAGEAAGFDTDTLLRMLDQGITFQKLLELIIARAECSQRPIRRPVSDETARYHCTVRNS